MEIVSVQGKQGLQVSQEGEGEAAVILVPKGTKSAGFVGFAVIYSLPP